MPVFSSAPAHNRCDGQKDATLNTKTQSRWAGQPSVPTRQVYASSSSSSVPIKEYSGERSEALLSQYNVNLKGGWTKRCCDITVILQQLHSKTVLAHIGAFPNKCTIKHHCYTTATWKVWKFMKTSSLCPVWRKKTFLQYYINSQLYRAYYPKWFK